MAEFKKPYDKACGFWHVTTEGDCEGRSITDLGVFEGNIDTIALALADRCYYYTLYFTAVDPTAYDKAPKKDEINWTISMTCPRSLRRCLPGIRNSRIRFSMRTIKHLHLRASRI